MKKVIMFIVIFVSFVFCEIDTDSLLMSMKYTITYDGINQAHAITNNEQYLFTNTKDTIYISYMFIVSKTDTLVCVSITTAQDYNIPYSYCKFSINNEVIEGECTDITKSLSKSLIDDVYIVFNKYMKSYIIYMDYKDFGDIVTTHLINTDAGLYSVYNTISTMDYDIDEYIKAYNVLK